MPGIADVYADLEKQAVLRALQRIPSNGKYFELWNLNVASVAQFLKDNQVTKVVIAGEGEAKPAGAKTAAVGPVWWLKWGGFPGPHLHFREEIYALNPEQWTAFSRGVIDRVTEQLKAAGKLSFDQVMAISEVTARI
jgi:hypothetical protein